MNVKALGNLSGWAIAGAMVLSFFLGEQAEPVDNLVPNSPAAEVINPCPAGWDFYSETDHAFRLACERNGWTVVLTSSLGFDYGLNTNDPNGVQVRDPSAVPGWR